MVSELKFQRSEEVKNFMVSRAKLEASARYSAKTYDTLNVRIRKDRGGKELVQEAAQRAGQTTGLYIMQAVYARMAAEGMAVPGGDDQGADGE